MRISLPRDWKILPECAAKEERQSELQGQQGQKNNKSQKSQKSRKNQKSQKDSLNKLARDSQHKLFLVILSIIIFFVFISYSFMAPAADRSKTSITKTIPDMTGVLSSEFTESANTSVLEKEAGDIEVLQKQVAKMHTEMERLQQSLVESRKDAVDREEIVRLLKTKIREMAGRRDTRSVESLEHSVANKTDLPLEQPSTARLRGIATTSFSYPKESGQKAKSRTQQPKTWKNFVVPGSFARAIVLNGADTNAGVHGNTDTTPITLRILDDGTLPNGKHSSLRGCFVTAAAYGNASSERGEVRLQHLSCIRASDRILSVPVEGYLTDQGGTGGIRGHVAMRNGALLWHAGFSGFLSGIGGAMQQSLTTQSISPLGTTTNVPTSDVLQYGAYGGANTALGKLADYYIKLADLYHPIVQIHAGSVVDVVFLKGFSLDIQGEESGIEKTEKAEEAEEHERDKRGERRDETRETEVRTTAVETLHKHDVAIPPNIESKMRNLKDMRLGERVDME